MSKYQTMQFLLFLPGNCYYYLLNGYQLVTLLMVKLTLSLLICASEWFQQRLPPKPCWYGSTVIYTMSTKNAHPQVCLESLSQLA